MKRHLPALFLTSVLAAACGSPRHLQYDYGRAFTQAMWAQSDLTRPSVADQAHPLFGVEAQAIRLRVKEAATDTESGESELETGNN